MSRCIKCNLEVLDDSIECPLCHEVLRKSGKNKMNLSHGSEYKQDEKTDMNSVYEQDKNIEYDSENSYPEVVASTKRMQFVMRLVIFAAIVTETVAFITNVLTFDGFWWSFLVGAGLLFGCLTLFLLFHKKKSLQSYILTEMFLAIIFSFWIDELLGYEGWSVTFAIPIAFMAVDVSAGVLMIVNIENWQSFIMTEIVTFVLSTLHLILSLCGVFQVYVLVMTAPAVTGLILLGTVLFGEKMVIREIERRFRI